MLTGEMNSKERKRVMDDFSSSAEGALICNVKVLQEGVDLPGADMVRTVVNIKLI